MTAHETALDGRSYRLSVTQQSQGQQLALSAQTSEGTSPALLSLRTRATNRTTYITDDGAFERTVGPNETVYTQPNATTDIVPTGSSYVENVLTDADFRPNGTVQENGQTFYRISADLPDLTREFDDVEATDFSADAFVDENGVVRSIGYRLVVSDGNGSDLIGVSLSVSGLGATSVGQPRWLDRASDEDQLYTTRPVANETYRTGLTVSGSRANTSTVSLANASERFYNASAVAAARASAVVTATSPGDVTVDAVTMGYDDARVPDSDEQGLVVFAYLPQYEAFVPMETRYDPVNDTVRASGLDNDVTVTVDGESVQPTFGGLPSGTTFVVVHAPTYAERAGS